MSGSRVLQSGDGRGAASRFSSVQTQPVSHQAYICCTRRSAIVKGTTGILRVVALAALSRHWLLRRTLSPPEQKCSQNRGAPRGNAHVVVEVRSAGGVCSREACMHVHRTHVRSRAAPLATAAPQPTRVWRQQHGHRAERAGGRPPSVLKVRLSGPGGCRGGGLGGGRRAGRRGGVRRLLVGDGAGGVRPPPLHEAEPPPRVSRKGGPSAAAAACAPRRCRAP